jgi:hypothetical protein
MVWINSKPLRLILPRFYDEFIRSESFKIFKSLGKVVSLHKISKMPFGLIMGVIIIPLHGGFFECAVHTLDLPICPGMIDFCETVLNRILMAYTIKNMNKCVLIHFPIGELNAVIGEDRLCVGIFKN